MREFDREETAKIAKKTTEVAKTTAMIGIKTGWVLIEGIWVPLDLGLDYQEGLRGFRKFAAASFPALPPGIAAIAAAVSGDLTTGLYTGGVAWWIEGVLFSAAQNFICPPSERLLRRKVVSLGKILSHPHRFLKLP